MFDTVEGEITAGTVCVGVVEIVLGNRIAIRVSYRETGSNTCTSIYGLIDSSDYRRAIDFLSGNRG